MPYRTPAKPARRPTECPLCGERSSRIYTSRVNRERNPIRFTVQDESLVNDERDPIRFIIHQTRAVCVRCDVMWTIREDLIITRILEEPIPKVLLRALLNMFNG